MELEGFPHHFSTDTMVGPAFAFLGENRLIEIQIHKEPSETVPSTKDSEQILSLPHHLGEFLFVTFFSSVEFRVCVTHVSPQRMLQYSMKGAGCQAYSKTSVFGALAQLGERLICIQKVSGSNPLGSTTFQVCCEATLDKPQHFFW